MEEYTCQQQYVSLRDITLPGRVLDIGGGGEGIIALHSGDRVVAIDKRRDELAETAEIGLKIIMDATCLQFLDATFDTVTCFYTLLYMQEPEIAAFLSEAFRVLKPGGHLWIWDTVIPAEAKADVFIVPVEVSITDAHTVRTGYGVGWRRGQTAEAMCAACEQAGLTAISQVDDGQAFRLCLQKKR